MIPAAVAARFRVVRELGQGGFGAVYLAQQVDPDRPVALKVLLTLSDEEQVRRFAREAKLTALVDHPGVVRLLEHGVDEGVPWIAYEHVPGGNLRERMASGRLPLADALSMAIQITEGLGAAHAAGLVHRDVKPENVLLGGDGVYKIADFGIAKPGVDRSWHTTPGVVLGTPWYIAPETLKEQAAPSSDLYAVGIMLWELIDGAPPCGDAEPLSVMKWHLAPERPRLSGVSRVVAAVVERSICTEPNDRYAGAAELAAALRDARAFVESAPRPALTKATPVIQLDEAERESAEPPAEALVAGAIPAVPRSGELTRIPSRPDRVPTIRVRTRPDAAPRPGTNPEGLASGHSLRSNSRPDASQSGPLVRSRSRPDVRMGSAARERAEPVRSRVYAMLAGLTLALGAIAVWLTQARQPPAPPASPEMAVAPRPVDRSEIRAASEFDALVAEWLRYHDGSVMNPVAFIDHEQRLVSMANSMYTGLEPLARRFDGVGDPLDDYALMLLLRRSALAWNWACVNHSYKRPVLLVDEAPATAVLRRFGKALLAARLRALDGSPQFARHIADVTQSVFEVARGTCGLVPKPAWIEPLDRELADRIETLPASPQRASRDLDPLLRAAWRAGRAQYPTSEVLAEGIDASLRLDKSWNVESTHRWLESEAKRYKEHSP